MSGLLGGFFGWRWFYGPAKPPLALCKAQEAATEQSTERPTDRVLPSKFGAKRENFYEYSICQLAQKCDTRFSHFQLFINGFSPLSCCPCQILFVWQQRLQDDWWMELGSRVWVHRLLIEMWISNKAAYWNRLSVAWGLTSDNNNINSIFTFGLKAIPYLIRN